MLRRLLKRIALRVLRYADRTDHIPSERIEEIRRLLGPYPGTYWRVITRELLAEVDLLRLEARDE